MKTGILLISIFSVVNMHQNNLNVHDQNREIFKQRIDEKHNNFLQLITDKSSASGVFYGVELLKDKPPLYYSAPLEEVEIKGDQIKFSLNKCSFSHTPFYKEKKNVLLDPDDKSIPISLKFPIKYFGSRQPDKLNLQRTLIIYDSRADEAIFVKITDSE